MTGYDQLIEQLTRLGDYDFVTVIEQARRNRMARQPAAPERPAVFDRDALARWYAARHLSIEPDIREVIYLPGNAPADEIRLLEVNVLSRAPDDAPIEALDFQADRDLPGAHRLLVADISPGQWEQIRAGNLELPGGWVMAGNQVFGRRG